MKPSGTLDIRLTPLSNGKTTVLFTKNNYKQARFINIGPAEVWYLLHYLTPEIEVRVTHDEYPSIKTRDDVLDLFAAPGSAPDGDYNTFDALAFLAGESASGITFDEAYEVFEREGPNNPLAGQTAETFKPVKATKVILRG